MSFSARNALVALPYLTRNLTQKLSEDGASVLITGLTTPQELATKTGVDDGAALEAALVAAGLIARTPGWFHTPRYNLTEAGGGFIILAKSGRALSNAAIRVKMAQVENTSYAGDAISLQRALLGLVSAGILATTDGGATFSVAI